jgi:hypothetical protein
MALPGSGQLGINQIRNELGTSNGSLRALSASAGKGTPDAISEFYGYSATSIPYSYGSPRVLHDFANTAQYGNGQGSVADTSGNGNTGYFTQGTLCGSIINTTNYSGNGYEFQTSPEYSIRSDGSRNLMAGVNSYSFCMWYYHRGFQTSYPGIDAMANQMEFVITNDTGGYRGWHKRGGNYAITNFGSYSGGYPLNYWHFIVCRYSSNSTVSFDWYMTNGSRITNTTSSTYGFSNSGCLQIPLRYNNYLYSRVSYYSAWNYDIGGGGSDTIFAATRGRYGR